MKLTKNLLREHKIYNSHDIARVAGQKLFIAYSPADTGRGVQPASWDIIGMGFKTDPAGAWYHYGHKSFSMYGRNDKAGKLEEALRWVKENYQIAEWERDVFGSYQIVGTLEQIAGQLTPPS